MRVLFFKERRGGGGGEIIILVGDTSARIRGRGGVDGIVIVISPPSVWAVREQ